MMYSQLSAKTADYNYTLNVDPSSAMLVTGTKNQVLHEFDDNSVSVVSISSQASFRVELRFDDISDTTRDLLMNLWGDYTKADGMRRTFYWKHPVPAADGNYKYYTVRLLSPLTVTYQPHLRQSVGAITILVEGNKPA